MWFNYFWEYVYSTYAFEESNSLGTLAGINWFNLQALVAPMPL